MNFFIDNNGSESSKGEALVGFFLDTTAQQEERADTKASKKSKPDASASFFLDTSSQSSAVTSNTKSKKRQHNSKKGDLDNSEVGMSKSAPVIFESLLDEGVLGVDIQAPTVDTNDRPKSKRPRFSRQVMNARFYDSSEENLKYDSLNYKPGEISSELRAALGLGETDLPLYIYKMRVLGYPPGWLTEAMESSSSSGITIFDNITLSPMRYKPKVKEERYDVSKLIKYPGFNWAMPHNVRDNHKKLGFPSMQMHHHLSHFIAFLNDNKMVQSEDAFHTRLLREHRQLENDNVEELSMDLDSGDSNLSNETDPENKDILELEEERLRLLRALEDGEIETLDSFNVNFNADDSLDKEVIQSPESPDAAEKLQFQLSQEAENEREKQDMGRSICAVYGSPVFASVKPLPDVTKFGKGILEFNPFENLSTSTGCFERVHSVVKKIREVLPKIS